MDVNSFVLLVFLFILTVPIEATVQVIPYNSFIESQPQRHVYNPTQLRSFRPSNHDRTEVNSQTYTGQSKKKNKRGRKGGVKARIARRNKRPVLPVLVMGNARSLNNKHDELEACTRYMHEYRNASILCFSESWLKEEMPDSAFELEHFTLKRGDRDVYNLTKSCGGGVCAYINSKWCHPNNVNQAGKICNKDVEIMSLSLRPYYLPREFNKIILNVVYIPCDANANSASDELTSLITQQMTSSPDAVIITTGDFNHVTLDSTLQLYQHVTCATRQDKTLDCCYTNIRNAYKSQALPPLGSSDHNMVLLMPQYKTKLKTTKAVEKTIYLWDESGCERLRGCFACTDWDVFYNTCSNIDELNDVVCSYINFCQETVLTKKKVKCYGNNKPWVTKELKELLNDKKRAFMEKNIEKKKTVQKLLKKKIKECQKNYKSKIEENFKSNNMRNVWTGMKNMVGYNTKTKSMGNVEKGKEQEYVNKLNEFYARFDSNFHLRKIDDLKDELKHNDETITYFDENDVKSVFSRLKTNKANGPDMITSKILNICSNELSSIFTLLFNLSMNTISIPLAWKTSQITPVPKSTTVNEMNDLRPVALTSILMKCLERLVLNPLLRTCEPCLDPYQFAYKSKRGVDDAILLFVDNLYRHLDGPKCYVRTLFIDFSSAFNTIQPHILVPKLLDMGLNKNLTLWILDFLTQRPQFVCTRINNNVYKSTTKITNTGAPQGTVLAPFLFSIYTNDCKTRIPNIPIIKYADDTSIQALIKTDSDLDNYRMEIDRFVNWCEENDLHLNVKKTKEIIFDFRTKNNQHDNVEIKNEHVEKVKEYKYLGVVIDEKLEWRSQSTKVLKNIRKRMFFMRKLYSFRVDNKLLNLFYQTCIQSVIMFSLTSWGGNNRQSEKTKINRCLKNAGRMLNITDCDNFDTLYNQLCIAKLNKILEDRTHPLHNQIAFSQRSGRLLHLKTRKQRYFNSFLPSAVRFHCDVR